MEEPCERGAAENLISRGGSFESGKFSLGTRHSWSAPSINNRHYLSFNIWLI